MSDKPDKYMIAASNLAHNPDYLLLKSLLISQLSDTDSIILAGSDSSIARAHVHDVGIRNFFRWVDKTGAGSTTSELASIVRPFEHYTSEQN